MSIIGAEDGALVVGGENQLRRTRAAAFEESVESRDQPECNDEGQATIHEACLGVDC